MLCILVLSFIAFIVNIVAQLLQPLFMLAYNHSYLQSKGSKRLWSYYYWLSSSVGYWKLHNMAVIS